MATQGHSGRLPVAVSHPGDVDDEDGRDVVRRLWALRLVLRGDSVAELVERACVEALRFCAFDQALILRVRENHLIVDAVAGTDGRDLPGAPGTAIRLGAASIEADIVGGDQRIATITRPTSSAVATTLGLDHCVVAR